VKSGGKDEVQTLAQVIECIGFGAAQMRAALLGGGVWLADGSELLLIATVTRDVSKEWSLEAWQRGIVVSVVFMGILMGNMICGPLGDRLGRRLPILISYVGIATFSILSACAQGFYQLAAIRLFVGASFGVGQPAFNTLCTEVTPTHWRIFMNSFSSGLFVVGELYSALLVWYDDPDMRRLDWRWLLLMGAIPSVILFVLASFLLHEAPSFLAVEGKHEKAKEVLESMQRDNRATGFSVDFKQLPPRRRSTPVQAIVQPFQVIFSWRLLLSTIIVIYSCFTLNTLFYGCLYAFPQVVTDVDMSSAPAVSLIIGALWELPGICLATVCGAYWPRKPVMAGYLVASALSLVAFAMGANHHIEHGTDHGSYDHLLHGGYIGIKVFACVGFVAVYQYSTEIYPTVARTTGTAACIAGGRLGGMIAPMVFEKMLAITSSLTAFFYFVAALCICNFVLVFLLPIETFGKSLEDHTDETQPLTH